MGSTSDYTEGHCYQRIPPPTIAPTKTPSLSPIKAPSTPPVKSPSSSPEKSPSTSPTKLPSTDPTTLEPSARPSSPPTKVVSLTLKPTNKPINEPTFTVTIQESVSMKNLALSDLNPADLKNGLDSVLAYLGCGFNPATILIQECTAEVMKINGEKMNLHAKDGRLLQRKLQTPTLRIEYVVTFEAACGTGCNDAAAVERFVYSLATGVVSAPLSVIVAPT